MNMKLSNLWNSLWTNPWTNLRTTNLGTYIESDLTKLDNTLNNDISESNYGV